MDEDDDEGDDDDEVERDDAQERTEILDSLRLQLQCRRATRDRMA